ncbi:uncharacterized protein A4U43_C08F28100 [Asparagus officinalis]|nr:uncharacterized protein A4U43_C08F28100 [Asparagus officinalis]
MGLTNERLVYLESGVLAEKRKKEDAFDRDHAGQTKSEELQSRLNEEVQELEARIAHLELKASETTIIEKYNGSYLGKVKVIPVCKAGFDFLRGELPPKLLEDEMVIDEGGDEKAANEDAGESLDDNIDPSSSSESPDSPPLDAPGSDLPLVHASDITS